MDDIDIEKLQDEINGLEMDVFELNAEIECLEEELMEKDTIIDDLKGDIDSLEHGLEDFNYNRVTADELDSVVSDLEDALRKIEDFRNSLD